MMSIRILPTKILETKIIKKTKKRNFRVLLSGAFF